MNNNMAVDTLGKCWSFPPKFSPDGVQMTSGTKAILQSLQVLFITEPGERIMRETWGGGLRDYLFANVSDELLAKMRSRIEESILRYETRVIVDAITIEPRAQQISCLQVQTAVRLAGTNITASLAGEYNLLATGSLRLTWLHR